MASAPRGARPHRTGDGRAVAEEVVEAPPSTSDVLRSALRTTVHAEQTGAAVSEQLAEQREQIERTQRKVDEIEAHADRSHFILRGMSSVFSTIRNKFTRQPTLPADVVAKREAERSARRAAMEDELLRAQEAAEAAVGPGRVRGGKPAAAAAGTAPAAAAASRGASGAAGRVDTGIYVSKDPRYREEDEIVARISHSLVGVKAQADTIHAELRLQNGMLDDLTSSVDRTIDKVDAAASKAHKLAKS